MLNKTDGTICELELLLEFQDAYELVRKHLLKFGLPAMDLEDVIQDTLYTAYLKRDTLRNSDKIKPWLRRIAENTALQHIRRAKKNTMLLENITEMIDAQHTWYRHPNEFDVLQQQEAYCVIQREIRKLGTRYSTILKLHYLDGYTLQQAAEKMNLNYNTAKTLHSRALKKLKTALTDMDDERLI